MGYENRDTYLPCKYWIEKDELHRCFYEREEDLYESPRDWSNLGIIVNFSSYCITGSEDEDVKNHDFEEWLLSHTDINESWYESHKKSYGIDGLINKFIKEKCAAFQFLSIYDHSGITISCGLSHGWDYTNVGFIYVPKDSEEYLTEVKSVGTKKAKEWADDIIKGEIRILDDYLQGNVYCIIEEVYDTETKEWEQIDSLGNVYLTSNTWNEEQEAAAKEIAYNFSLKNKFIDETIILEAMKNNEIDVLYGQKMFKFEVA